MLLTVMYFFNEWGLYAACLDVSRYSGPDMPVKGSDLFIRYRIYYMSKLEDILRDASEFSLGRHDFNLQNLTKVQRLLYRLHKRTSSGKRIITA